MSIGNLILGVNSVTVSYLIRYETLLQNAKDIITKCDSYFVTKCHRGSLQNVSGFLLQNVFYYKMLQLLQFAMILLQNGTVITKCDNNTYNNTIIIATKHTNFYLFI